MDHTPLAEWSMIGLWVDVSQNETERIEAMDCPLPARVMDAGRLLV